MKKSVEDITVSNFYQDIRRLIDEARYAVASTVNAAITMLYWQIGKRINEEILKGKRAEYGREIIVSLARQLVLEYGNNFSEKNLRRMIQFAEVYPSKEIVVSLIRHLSWTHFIALIPLKEPLQREFYTEMCRIERWSVRTLRKKIDSMLYERTAISRKPEELAKQEYEKEKDENDPLVLILCAEGTHEQIELLELDKSSIKIAEYLTELPPKELLEKKLHAAIEKSRALLEQRSGEKGVKGIVKNE